MGIDAVMLLRPKKPSLLRGVFDPETASVDVLDDGAILVWTFARYDEIEHDVDGARSMISQAIADAHDDPRGVLFFPDVCEPRGRTYDAVVGEVACAGVWVPARPLTDEEREARVAGVLAEMKAPAVRPRRELPPIEELQARMQEKMNELLADPAFLAGMMETLGSGCAAILVQRPSHQPLEAKHPGVGVNETCVLGDGSTAVLTNRAGQDAIEMVALGLGERLGEWLSEHRDPRGVPAFMATSLDTIASAKSYDEALARLGAAVTFVRPHTTDDVIAERKARFRAFLESEG